MHVDLKGWTQELFDRKLSQLVSVIARMNEGGAGIPGVYQMENKYVLDALIATVALLLFGVGGGARTLTARASMVSGRCC